MKQGLTDESTTVTDFVIVRESEWGLVAWTAPRGRNASYRSGWTMYSDNAAGYKTAADADRAIERGRKGPRKADFRNAKYCTFGEWRRAVRGEE